MVVVVVVCLFLFCFLLLEAGPLYIFPWSYLMSWMGGKSITFLLGKYHSGRNVHSYTCNTAPLVALKPKHLAGHVWPINLTCAFMTLALCMFAVLQVNPRLDGCMKEWHWLTDEDTSIQETIRHNERMQCYSAEDHSSFFPGHGFAYFSHSHGVFSVCWFTFILNILIILHTGTFYVWLVDSNRSTFVLVREGSGRHLSLNSLSHTGDTQVLSVQLTIRPASTTGVLFALVRQDTVPLSISFSDYHSGTKQWAQVSKFCSTYSSGKN